MEANGTNGNGTNGNGTAGNMPVARVRQGPITVSIWETEGQYGPLFSCHLQRVYFDADKQPQYTSSLGRRHMLEAAEALRSANAWCVNRENAYRAAQNAGAGIPSTAQTLAQQAGNGKTRGGGKAAGVQAQGKPTQVMMNIGGRTLPVDADVAASIAALQDQVQTLYDKLGSPRADGSMS
jgi:hypothetical protein